MVNTQLNYTLKFDHGKHGKTLKLLHVHTTSKADNISEKMRKLLLYSVFDM